MNLLAKYIDDRCYAIGHIAQAQCRDFCRNNMGDWCPAYRKANIEYAKYRNDSRFHCRSDGFWSSKATHGEKGHGLRDAAQEEEWAKNS